METITNGQVPGGDVGDHAATSGEPTGATGSARLLVYPPDEGARLDQFLAARTELSRRAARRLIGDGLVMRNGEALRVQSRELRAGDVIVRFAGSEVDEYDDLPVLLRRRKPGDEVEVTVTTTDPQGEPVPDARVSFVDARDIAAVAAEPVQAIVPIIRAG